MSEATAYSTEVPIPSCFITKQLIQDLETCMIKELCGIEGQEEAEIRKHFTLTMKDKSGSEELGSITALSDARFPNDIKAISLRYVSRIGPRQCAMKTAFSDGRIGTEFQMELKGIDSRKTVHNTKLHLFDILAKNKTWRWLFNPTIKLMATIGAILSIIGFGLLLPAISLMIKDPVSNPDPILIF